jgi:hypothetical protein
MFEEIINKIELYSRSDDEDIITIDSELEKFTIFGIAEI